MRLGAPSGGLDDEGVEAADRLHPVDDICLRAVHLKVVQISEGHTTTCVLAGQCQARLSRAGRDVLCRLAKGRTPKATVSWPAELGPSLDELKLRKLESDELVPRRRVTGKRPLLLLLPSA